MINYEENGSSLENPREAIPPQLKPPLALIGFLSYPAMFLVSIFVLSFIIVFNTELVSSPIVMFGVMALAEILAVLVAYLLSKSKSFIELFKIRKIKWIKAFYTILIGIALYAGLQVIAIIVSLTGATVESSDTSAILESTVSWERMLLLFVLVPLLIPIIEEFFFRGVIFNFINRGLNGKKASVIAYIFSASVFGLAHFQGASSLMDLVVVVWSGLVGLLAAFLYVKNDSIIAPILLHVSYNSMNVVMMLAVA